MEQAWQNGVDLRFCSVPVLSSFQGGRRLREGGCLGQFLGFHPRQDTARGSMQCRRTSITTLVTQNTVVYGIARGDQAPFTHRGQDCAEKVFIGSH